MSGGDLAREVIAKVGIWWPAGDETALRAAADLWSVFADNVDLLAGDASSAAKMLVGANSGPAVDAFDAFWARYDGAPDAYLPALATAARAMGTALDHYADTVHRAKKRLEEMAVTAGATVLLGTGLAVFTFGASEEAAAQITAGLVTAAEALSVEVSAEAAAIVGSVLGDAAVAAAENAVLDIVVAQPVRVLGFHDGGFSLTEVEQALTSGAEQGAAGGLSRVLNEQPGGLGVTPGSPGQNRNVTPRTPKSVREKLGNLLGKADERAADVVRQRGGGGKNIAKIRTDYQQMTLRELAGLAAAGDEDAETAIKIVKQAGQKGQRRYGS